MIDADLLPDAVLRLDANRNVAEVNRAVAAVTGFAPADLVGRPIDEALDPRGRDGRPLLAGDWHASASLRSVRAIPEQTVEIRHAAGANVRVLVTGRYLRGDGGNLEGAVLALRSAERRTHLAAQGIEIVSTVSHELRSPLTSVKGYTSLLLNRWERLKDDQKRMMLEQVNQDADRVTRLITELLDISRLETGRLTLRRQLVDLRWLAGTVVDKVRLAYANLDASLSFADDLPRVFADPDKVEQVLTNLVENAAKYGSPIGLRIVATLNDAAGTMTVEVIDQGPGIPDAILGHIFDKFFRPPETRPSGSGLGLWISRGLVEAHGGTLIAESNQGKGSTFRFTLPVAADLDLEGA